MTAIRKKAKQQLHGNDKHNDDSDKTTATHRQTTQQRQNTPRHTPQNPIPPKKHTLPHQKQPQHKAVNYLLKNSTKSLLNKKIKQFPKCFFDTSFRRAVAVVFVLLDIPFFLLNFAYIVGLKSCDAV